METIKISGPAYFAVALIYDDESGMSDHDVADLQHWIDTELPLGYIVIDCDSEPHYQRWNGVLHEMITYTAIKP